MKNMFYFILLYAMCMFSSSCSVKKKISTVDKFKTSYMQKAELEKASTLEQFLKDSSASHYLLKEGSFQAWNLKGKVQLLTDGSMQAEEATIYSWTAKEETIEEVKTNSIQNLLQETEIELIEEQSSQTSKAKSQNLNKIEPSWWILGIVIVVVLVSLWSLLRKYLS